VKENTMKIKTSELTGTALDWAVAKCENADWSDEDCIVNVTTFDEYDGTIQNYSTDWAQGGPIIEREGCALWLSNEPDKGLWASADKRWMGLPADSDEFLAMPDPWHGPTPLIAAMRCFVASRLGDEVDIPEELK
jgi:hypothetical protein